MDANEILMGGASGPGAKFAEPGDSITGEILRFSGRQERVYDPKNPGNGPLAFFPSGDPIMGIVVVLQTQQRDPSIPGDDGVRTVYVEGQELKATVRRAVQAAGAKGLEVGGLLTVTFTHRENPYDTKSKKFYTAEFVPARAAAANTALLQSPAPQQYAAPAPPQQQYAPQAPVPAGYGQPAPQPQYGQPQGYPQAVAPAQHMTPEQMAALGQLGAAPVQPHDQAPY